MEQDEAFIIENKEIQRLKLVIARLSKELYKEKKRRLYTEKYFEDFRSRLYREFCELKMEIEKLEEKNK